MSRETVTLGPRNFYLRLATFLPVLMGSSHWASGKRKGVHTGRNSR